MASQEGCEVLPELSQQGNSWLLFLSEHLELEILLQFCLVWLLLLFLNLIMLLVTSLELITISITKLFVLNIPRSLL